MKPSAFLVTSLLVLAGIIVQAQPDISLFNYWRYHADQKNVLYNTLTDIAIRQLEDREKVIKNLSTPQQWLKRQADVKAKLHSILGDFPESTPLNPRVTGILQADGFRVEKVIYESQPGQYVTSILCIPDNLKERAPAILYCSGHTFEGFRSVVYQHAIFNLVKKGFIVLAFDPVGQGERQQYLDENKLKSKYSTPTHEHSYVGGQMFISGESIAKSMIWDGIRSIDYLVSREEVDASRIGVTGRSGGGTQTVYISAFDERVAAAAPENYVTSFRYLMESIGPQDAEQNLPYFLKNNLDLADLLEVRAPKPVLIIATLNDFFSIQGARETYQEARLAYASLGKSDHIRMSEDVATHESTLKNRQAMYAFFQEFLNNPGDPEDEDVKLFHNGELTVTETGQVITSPDAETLFSLHQKRTGLMLEKSVAKDENPASKEELKRKIRDLTGYEKPDAALLPVFSGTLEYEGMSMDKYLLKGEGVRKIPLIVLHPGSTSRQKAILILNPEGKARELQSGMPLYFAQQGFHVIIPDITGCGELDDGDDGGDSYINHASYNIWYAGILTGKSIAGLRMEDISRICEFVSFHLNLQENSLWGIGKDVLSSDLLQYSALSGCFERIILIDPLISQKSLVMNRDYDPKYIQSTVAGSLPHYDFPDLISTYAPSKMLMIDIKDQAGKNLDLSTMNPDIEQMLQGYRTKNAEHNLELKSSDSNTLEMLFGSWIK